jgi:hypothetical protein
MKWHAATCWLGVASACLIFAWPAPAVAQSRTAHESQQEADEFLQRQEMLLREWEQSLAAEESALSDVDFDFGGWYSNYIFLFDDGLNSSRTFRRYDLRLWSRLSLDQGAHEFYARVRTSFLDFNTGDSYDGQDDDVEGPNLERSFYHFDLGRARGDRGRLDPDGNLMLHFGRDLVTLGSGLTLATPLDHVAAIGAYGDFSLRALAGQTVGSTTDFDASRYADRTERAFFGAELRYHGVERQEPFVYVLWQQDHQVEPWPRPFQRFEYDSFYLGAGAEGELWERLGYNVEGVMETGSAYGDRQWLRTNTIRAWAFNAQLEYFIPGPHRARVEAEYLFGSGDGDRPGSPTNSAGGHAGLDETDNSFVAFGYRNTGLAFAPRYSNLHMVRVGASCYPWPESEWFGEFEMGTDWFAFHKHQSAGGVSDPTADLAYGWLGWEADVYANWRITSDVAATTRLGLFFPGSAFSDDGTRAFLLVGMTWSF